MLTFLNIIGTRPEAIKMAPVIHAQRGFSDSIHPFVCSTGQHRQMLDDAFQFFDIKPDYELAVMQGDQSLSILTASLLESLNKVVIDAKPDWILAQGDTTSVMTSALVAFYHRIPFAHVEAGLRTGNIYSPFPEEMNRIIADKVAALLFAPTSHAKQQLINRGLNEERIFVTGNTIIDALHMVTKTPYSWEQGQLASIPRDKRIVLITAHRRESFGAQIEQIHNAVRILANRFAADDILFVYPVHLNPRVYEPANRILGKTDNVMLLPPLDYLSLVNLMQEAVLVLTDSGGIQEEAPTFGKPVLVLRNDTERPEGVTAGVSRLVGTSTDVIVEAVTELLTNQQAYDAMAQPKNPYGDGMAAQRIVQAILTHRGEGAS
ncbi:UDP-N-acetylglucosamine 2-epimerase [Methylophaga sp. 41_12_T18]|nr:UDP-N-acetylglucosamine 2-epimerase [Methylophaga sp. 41_12_T18]